MSYHIVINISRENLSLPFFPAFASAFAGAAGAAFSAAAGAAAFPPFFCKCTRYCCEIIPRVFYS